MESYDYLSFLAENNNSNIMFLWMVQIDLQHYNKQYEIK